MIVASAEKDDREAVAEVLRKGSRFLLTGHRNPDGDSLGSALALALALRAEGKTARVIVRDRWPSAYDFLPGLDSVEVSDSLPEGWFESHDAILVMECPEPERPGYPDLLRGNVINIDHHPGNTLYGRHNLVDLPAAAVGEMMADLLDHLGWPITREIATNIWVSLVSDTGSFRYGNTTAKALALAARLVTLGVEPGPVGEHLFESRPRAAVRLEDLVMGTMKFHSRDRIATVELWQRFLDETGAQAADSENLINRARGIEGVQAAILFREAGPPGEFRCSFRSKGTVDVRSVAAAFGGGGHRNAAGCGAQTTDFAALLQDIVSRVEAAIERAAPAPGPE
ncbi:MAG: DHH family phosphoesterase [Acidobacteria bacterium]|nr:DHH family phosphoesterase [Acidobacteriota bacterium]